MQSIEGVEINTSVICINIRDKDYKILNQKHVNVWMVKLISIKILIVIFEYTHINI